MPAHLKSIEDIHPGLWRASQLGRAAGATVDTGYPALSAQLPGGGWPRGALVELLTPASGVGEIRLLAPALAKVGTRTIVILNPVQTPNGQGLAYIGIPVDKVMMLKPTSTADTLWSAEQILRAGTCGALLLWQQHVRSENLRRLQLAAKTGDTLFVLFRPLAAAADPSPAELRLALRPIESGVSVEVVKRKGPALTEPINVELRPSPILTSPHRRTRRVVTAVELETQSVALD